MTGSHLDDESLSADLDAPDAGIAGHLAGCATCRARRDRLDAARRAVAAGPVPSVPPGLADRAVAAALAAYDDERARTGTSPETAAPPALAEDEAVVVPLHRPGRSPGRAPAHSRRRRPPAWALGAAAALAAVLVAVPLLDRDRDDPGQSVASAPSDTADRSAAAEAGPDRSVGVLDGGDLGDQSDPAALGRVLAEAVSGEKAAALASPAPDASGAGAPAGSAVSPPLDARAPAADEASAAAAPCEPAVQAEYGAGLGTLRYRATLRWNGTPAVVLAYGLADPGGSGPTRRAFVMSLDGCRLLVVQVF